MRYVTVVLQIALGFYFLLIGLGGAFDPSDQLLADFARWGYPRWFVTVVGLAETIGAVGMLLGTREQHFAAIGGLVLGATMIGAVLTHLVSGDGGWPLPLFLLLLCLIVVRTQVPALEAWLAERRAEQ